MSNPVTNAEVEDVLSSIRRLVSSDPRPADRSLLEEAEHTVATAQPCADRLVLSPALRVTAAPNPAAPIDVDQPEEESRAASEQEIAAKTEQPDLVSDASLAADGQESDETSDQQSAAEPTVDRDIEPDETIDVSKTIEVSETIEVEGVESEFYGPSKGIDPAELQFLFRARKRTPPLAEPVEIDAVTDEDPKNIEPEASPCEPDEVIEVEKPAPLLLTDPEPSAPAVEVLEESVESGEQSVDDHEVAEPAIFQASERRGDPVPPDELTAKIAALEAVVAQTPDQWEPDDDGVDEYAGTSVDSLAWEDHIDLDGSGAPLGKDHADQVVDAIYDAEASVVVPDQATDEDQAWPGFENEVDEIVAATESEHHAAAIADLADETTDGPLDDADDGSVEISLATETSPFDEAELRDLISDIVQQELNGPLGERITQNVRKLVRRELQRALAAGELQ